MHEDDIAKHRDTAQGMVTRMVIVQRDDGRSRSQPGRHRAAASYRPCRPAARRRTREVEFTKTVAAVHADDPMMSIAQHSVLYRVRRGLAVALALADVFAMTDGPGGAAVTECTAAPLSGEAATHFKALLSASGYVAAFSFAAYLLQLLSSEAEPANDTDEPDFPVRHASGCAEIDAGRARRGDCRRRRTMRR